MLRPSTFVWCNRYGHAHGSRGQGGKRLVWILDRIFDLALTPVFFEFMPEILKMLK